MKLTSSLLLLCLAFLLSTTCFSQDILVRGRITDRSGNAIPYASVIIKGTKIATSANANGEFQIKVPIRKTFLQFSAVGFYLYEVEVDKSTFLNISLKASEASLEEVLVVGYAMQKRSMVTGSAVQIHKKELSANNIQGDFSARSYFKGLGLSKKAVRDSMKNFNREGYEKIIENKFLNASDNPLSTFSIDVDVAAYSNIRRMLNSNQLPPVDAVRIEELINYFTYNYAQPTGKDPFSVNTEIAACPWNTSNKLISIGLQGKKIATENLPPSNLTFLIDVSGSMSSEDKLPLVISSLKLLTAQLRQQDKVSIVVYAGQAGLVLPPTAGSDKKTILNALDKLQAGGSTAGGQGIQLAYKTARENYFQQGNNRVVLCTDGDFNVGISSDDALEKLIENERESGIFLTVLGFGTGNYQDAKMQKLADKGNGNHAYIDNVSEAKKVLIKEFGGTMVTIAKDVKLQLKFNPSKVSGYRLIGYENRMLAKEDFDDDKKDAGELGSGHTVTALYEIIPAGTPWKFGSVDSLRYQRVQKSLTGNNNDLLNIQLRYKEPAGSKSRLMQVDVEDPGECSIYASSNLRLAAAIAQFGMLLRNSAYKGKSNYQNILDLVSTTLKNDAEGYRTELISLVEKAIELSKTSAKN